MRIIGITGQAGSGKDEAAGRLVKKHGFTQLSLADPLKRFGLNVFGFDVIQLWGPSSARNTFDPGFQECAIRSSQVNFEPGCSIGAVRRHCDPGWGDAAMRLADYGEEWVLDLLPCADRAKREEALRMLYWWFGSLGHHYNQLSPRIMLQSLGTEWGRQVVSNDIWIDNLLATAEDMLLGDVYEREIGFTGEKDTPPSGIVVSDVRFGNELTRIKDEKGKIVRVTREVADKKAKKLGIVGHASEAEQAEFTADMFDAVLANEGTLSDLYNAVDVVAAAYKSVK
jgi:hypothetical protein